jgi:hypothetical protein
MSNIMLTGPRSITPTTTVTHRYRRAARDYLAVLLTPALRNLSRACKASGECG